MRTIPPAQDGTPASHVQLEAGPWSNVLQALCARFPRIPAATWQSRLDRGRVLDALGSRVPADAPVHAGMDLYYYREVTAEPRVPFVESLLHVDEHLVVADKPHFLPVTPAGGYVRETLLARLVDRLGNPALVPLHRIDRATAGLVMFSANPESRDRYQALFRQRRIGKRYEAWATALPELAFPHVRTSRLVPGDPFFRMRETAGEPNSHTRVEVLERAGRFWRYGLEPVTGRKHQLRVHMAALGAPILHDTFYPRLADGAEDDHARPLQLLARSLRFVDPLSGIERSFLSELGLLSSAHLP